MPDHRELGSSKDVINFLRDNIVEGVNKAKDFHKDVKKTAPKATKAIENVFNDLAKDQKWLKPAKEIFEVIIDEIPENEPVEEPQEVKE